MKIIEGSLLAFSKNVDEMISQLITLRKSGIKNIHYDVMDGIFVPNTAFFGENLAIIKRMGFTISIHLMVIDVESYVDFFIKEEIDYLTFHCEALSNLESFKIIQKIKNKKIKCGIAIKPNTKISDVMDLINFSEIITLMSVEPGFGGQKFIPRTLDKLKEIRKYNKDIIIQVDGGLNLETSELISEYTNFFVMGTFLIDNINNSEYILKRLIR
ncbi:MAG: ribulose-phosphate 3-epimerase [Mycoplasmoidaceae bacterium]